VKKYFVDTNIILDFLGNRKPFGKYALQIFNKARIQEWELWTSDNSITTSYYFLEKDHGRNKAKEKIGLLLKYVEIQPVNKLELQTAVVSKFKDFEDAVQHFCALANGEIQGIITRNKKDFKFSQIPIFGPEEVFLDT